MLAELMKAYGAVGLDDVGVLLNNNLDTEENGLTESGILTTHVAAEEVQKLGNDALHDVRGVEHHVVDGTHTHEADVLELGVHVLGAHAAHHVHEAVGDVLTTVTDDEAESVKQVLHAVLLLAGGLLELVTGILHLTVIQVHGLVEFLQSITAIADEGDKLGS